MRLFATLICLGAPAQAEFLLALPIGATETYRAVEETVEPRVPVAAFEFGSVPAVLTSPPVTRTVWSFANGQSIDSIQSNLEQQIAESGFDLIFLCQAQSCGGFDFRFGIDAVTPPMMEIDLRDYRFLTAQLRTTEEPSYVTFLISRSPQAVFLQMTEYGTSPVEIASVTEPTQQPVRDADGEISEASDFAMVLEGLEFRAGSAALGADPQNSIAALAERLKSDPDLHVMLVGHSDLSGGLQTNIRLSLARAQSVISELISNHGIAANRMSAHGIGPLSPRADNATAAGKEKNRRVVAVFSKN